MEEIAAGKGKKRVWHSNRDATSGRGPPRAANASANSRRKSARQARARAAQSRSTKNPRSARARHKAQEPQGGGNGVGAQEADSRAARWRSAACRISSPPSLATLHEGAPSGENWLHEIKFDGYRIEARLDHGKVRLLTRKQLDWTHRFEPHRRRRSRRCRPRPRCLTANWSSRTTRAFRVSRCCRPI